MIQLKNAHLAVNIKTKGAELCSIKNSAGLEFLWQADEAVWARHAPILFPIVGRLSNDHYSFENKSYKLTQHGFARDLNFELLQSTNTEASFSLRSNAETKTNYPFDFQLIIRYVLNDNRITIAYEVLNLGKLDMLFSIGAHPGFRCPLLANERMEDYYLQFEDDSLQVTQLQDGLRTADTSRLALENNKLVLNSKLFDKDALVLENHQINEVTLKSQVTNHYIKMRCKDWPFFGIWSKKGNKDFICLEPWYGIADAVSSTGDLLEKKGIQKLGPNSQFSCEYSIELA